MIEKRSYFSRALVILMALMLVFTMMPSSMWGTTAYAEEECPVTVSIPGETDTALTATKTSETVTYNGNNASVYEVVVPVGTASIKISDYSGGNIITYNYDADKNYLAGWYDDWGKVGESDSKRFVDSNKDNVTDYIFVQKPYGSASSAGALFCVIKPVYQLPVTVTIGEKTITTTDTWVNDGYTSSNNTSDLYVINAEAGTSEFKITAKEESKFLAYNYNAQTGKIANANEYTSEQLSSGVAEATLKVDADNNGSADYISVEAPNNGQLQYALQVVVNGGLSGNDGTAIVARSDYEQQNIIKNTINALSNRTDYATNSDWVTALYASGGSLSDDNKKAYLKKVYGDIVGSTESGYPADLGTLAKDVIALTAMGYDPTKIQDSDGKNYDLLAELYNSDIADLGAYGINSAPYILLAYDTNKFTLPDTASLTREDLISYILEKQSDNGSWGGYTWENTYYPGTAGDTASIAHALLSYSSDNEKVAAAIEKANSFINDNLEGSKTSADYLAYIVSYESMQNKNANELIVDENTGADVIDYLLSYKTESDGKTYFTYGGKISDLATTDAFKALVAYKNLTDAVSTTSANIYDSNSWTYGYLNAVTGLPKISDSLDDIFIKAPNKLTYKVGDKIDLTGLQVTAKTVGGTTKNVSTEGITAEPTTITNGTQLSYSGFDTNTAGTKTVTVKYEEYDTYLGKSVARTADFIITVNNADGTPATKNAVSIGVYDADGKVVVRNNSYTIVAGKTTVMDVLKAVLGNAGKTYELKASGTYIAAIDGLGEFDKGENSGWMYKVDGNLPNIAASSYTLNGGEYIYWFYTKDWTTVPGATVMTEDKTVTTTGTTGAATTTSPADVKVTEQTGTDGSKEKVAEVTVSAANQKEILSQAKTNKSAEIVLNASSDSAKDASKVNVKLDKSFVNSIVSDTDAKLTVKTPLGDKTYTQDELKTLAAAATGSTVTLTIEKADSQDDTEDELDVKAEVAKLTPVARSSKTAKKYIKVTTSLDKNDKAIIAELKDAGYTVKYRFYRSTKKASSYKAKLTGTTGKYTNTAGKKGTRYYYKIQLRVYDQTGNLVAKTALKQCKYATRIFGK